MSYGGLVCKIKLSEHPNADNLSIGNCSGYQVIVSKDTEDDTLGIFFQADTQLSELYCLTNKLYRKDPATLQPMGGYLEPNRRVRTIKLRGEQSDGLWLPMTSLNHIPGSALYALKPGYEFNELHGDMVAQKYVTPATRRKMAAGLGKGVGKAHHNLFPDFHKHYDTPQLRANLHRIPQGSLITITEKLHGTSGRSGHLPCVQPRTWLQRLLRRPATVEWKHVMGSRNITIHDKTAEIQKSNPNYEPDNMRLKHHRRLSLRKGETVYYEIVGYGEGGSPVMPKYGVEGDDPVKKDIRKKFKPDMDLVDFCYGCEPGESEMYVYRITQISEGHVVELPWHQVVRRCKELDVPVVPLMVQYLHTEDDSEKVAEMCKGFCGIQSVFNPNSIKEGVCVRVEHPDLDHTFKYKSFYFCHLEGIAKQDDGYVDFEDIS